MLSTKKIANSNTELILLDARAIIVNTTDEIEKGNKGERGEVMVVKKVYNLSKIGDIESLKLIFGEDAEDGIIMYDIETNKPIEKEYDIKKAKSGCKADFMFKFIKNDVFVYCSIKCEHGRMPAILNHTPRSAKVFQDGGDLFTELGNLDDIILYLNKERTVGNVGEDIHIKNMAISEKSKKCIICVVFTFYFTEQAQKNQNIHQTRFLKYENQMI